MYSVNMDKDFHLKKLNKFNKILFYTAKEISYKHLYREAGKLEGKLKNYELIKTGRYITIKGDVIKYFIMEKCIDKNKKSLI